MASEQVPNLVGLGIGGIVLLLGVRVLLAQAEATASELAALRAENAELRRQIVHLQSAPPPKDVTP